MSLGPMLGGRLGKVPVTENQRHICLNKEHIKSAFGKIMVTFTFIDDATFIWYRIGARMLESCK